MVKSRTSQAEEKLEEMRLTFAKRAELLCVWFEESVELLSEPVELDTTEEVKDELGKLAAFKETLDEKAADVTALAPLPARSLRGTTAERTTGHRPPQLGAARGCRLVVSLPREAGEGRVRRIAREGVHLQPPAAGVLPRARAQVQS